MAETRWIDGDPWAGRPKPLRRSGNTHRDVIRAFIFAASIVGLCGVVLYGVDAAAVLCVSTASALAAESVLIAALGRRVRGSLSHACLSGLLLGLMLPPTVRWYVPLVGSMIAIVLGKGVFGGLGYYVWQPAVVGRVVVGFLFGLQFGDASGVHRMPVLASGHLLVGDLDEAKPADPGVYQGWFATDGPVGLSAWLVESPVHVLRRFAEGKLPPDGKLAYEPLLRDALPPWRDTVFGTVSGGIGETCSLGLIVAGFYLIYRGYLRWQLPAAMLAAAAVAAAILPIETALKPGDYDWFPVFASEQGRAVGLSYILYHLTAGELMLGAFLVAGDMMATPLRANGQMIFGVGLGVLTIFMRLYGVVDGECYWSILIMNTVVGMIDRHSRRPVLGLAPA